MLATILKVGVVIALIAGATFLIPDGIKQNATSGVKSVLSGIIPESAKEKIEKITLSPEEQRAKLLEQLENNIEKLKEGILGNATSTAAETIEETKGLVEKIKDANEKQGVVNRITTKIYDELTGKQKAENTSSTCPAL
ncbi:MAG: hypothetical protein Q8P01_02140 [bacterium]|nr:hypothetical protein [bacterium]